VRDILKIQPKLEMIFLYQTEIHLPLNIVCLLSADIFVFNIFNIFSTLNLDLGYLAVPLYIRKMF